MNTFVFGIIAVSGLCAVLCHAERRYHFVYEEKNMAEALSYCREKYTDLATIDNENDMKILNYMADLGKMVYSEYSYRAWIGLYDDVNSWRWSLTNGSFYKLSESEFINWAPGEPNNDYSEHCGQFYNGRWYDGPCGVNIQSICSNVAGSNVTFVLINTAMTWSEAQSYCREHHTDLAVVKNKEDNQEITNLLSPGEVAWIGLNRESWKWTDGSNSTFRYWKRSTDEPNNKMRNETCLSADFNSSGEWEDWPCYYKRAFICYSVPAVKQVIKVRLVKHGSTLDLNDPAVLEDVLNQLKQNLKDSGVKGDVRLSWKKQPDGKVFHKEETKERPRKRRRITKRREEL
ncbi:secretory phospholipase A2 receptor-like [Cheilinus undulatus]|uniref:secretory phospholipase A2 receptor-like n=1 Tax=Cheilinus undulatus TaxID=241271 RepID=UPI001BD653F7|nr:secretory phospholipase A2 receptor-like [Cheilinus undulatus]